MSENKVRFVKAGNVLFVGLCKDVLTELHKPRMVFVNHETNQVSLGRLMGSPDSVKVTEKPDFDYYNQDPEFEKFYLSETSEIQGLQIVK